MTAVFLFYSFATVTVGHAASLPTIGIEWEFDQGKIAITATKPDGTRTDPYDNSHGQPIFCTKETMGDRPLVSFTHDLPDNTNTQRTLEIVTGPIGYDDETKWTDVLNIVRNFFDTIDKSGSTAKIAPTDSKTAKYITLKDVLDRLGGDRYQYGKVCGGSWKDFPNENIEVGALSRIYFMYNNPAVRADNMQNETGATHVTVMLKLSELMDTKHMLPLYPGPQAPSKARDLYSKVVDGLKQPPYSQLSSPKDQEKLAFWALSFTARNIEMSSVINDVGGARFKDLFVLYPKTTLGQLNHALQNKVDVADLSLSNNDLKDAINASQPITAKLPNTYVDFQVWKQKSLEPNKQQLLQWNQEIVAGRSPYVVEKPIGAFIETPPGSASYVSIVMENRASSPLADAATLTSGIQWKNKAKMRELLSPFKRIADYKLAQ